MVMEHNDLEKAATPTCVSVCLWERVWYYVSSLTLETQPRQETQR